MRLPKGRRPVGPGDMIREMILEGYHLTQGELAAKLNITRPTLNRIVTGASSVTPNMALRLSRLTGSTPELWLNAQRAVDLWAELQEHKEEIEKIAPLAAS